MQNQCKLVRIHQWKSIQGAESQLAHLARGQR
jgi:hypothetical protein